MPEMWKNIWRKLIIVKTKMDIQVKIKRINKLNDEISDIRKFVELAKEAQNIDEKHAKNNELNGINKFIRCSILAYISTGSQSPKYDAVMTGDDIIVALMTAGLTGVEEKLKEKTEELIGLLNEN